MQIPALWLCLRLCQFKIFWDTWALKVSQHKLSPIHILIFWCPCEILCCWPLLYHVQKKKQEDWFAFWYPAFCCKKSQMEFKWQHFLVSTFVNIKDGLLKSQLYKKRVTWPSHCPIIEELFRKFKSSVHGASFLMTSHVRLLLWTLTKVFQGEVWWLLAS